MTAHSRLRPALLCAALAACQGSAAREPAAEATLAPPPSYAACRASAAPAIDGRLEPQWAAASWTADFADIRGVGPAPRLRTRAKLLWDDSALYIAAELEDPDVWASERERDAPVYLGNAFEVFLDPGGDARNYVELQLNALGTLADLLLVQPYRTGGPALAGWDLRGLRAGVQVQGSLNRAGDRDRGWTLELALPWAALAEVAPERRAPRSGESWPANLSRVHWPAQPGEDGYRVQLDPANGRPLPADYWVWSPQGAVDLHRPERWGSVRFAGSACGAAPAAAPGTANSLQGRVR